MSQMGTGRTSPIPPHGEWRLVYQLHGEPHPGEWVETDHPAVIEALGLHQDCAAKGCRLNSVTMRSER